MHRSMKRTVILLAVVGVTLAATLACQPSAEKAAPAAATVAPEPQPANDLELRGAGNTLINAIRVERGATTEFRVMNGKIFVLIPDSHLMIVDGETEVPATGGFLAFVVGLEGVTVKVPADYPKSEDDTVIRYSVLCVDEKGEVYYAEGGSPPDFIIPPVP